MAVLSEEVSPNLPTSDMSTENNYTMFAFQYIKELLMTDMPGDSEWNQYGVDVAYWTADPETEYIAYSMGMNINDEWGPLASKELKTPSSPAAVSKKAGKVPARILKQAANGTGTTPTAIVKAITKAQASQPKLSGK